MKMKCVGRRHSFNKNINKKPYVNALYVDMDMQYFSFAIFAFYRDVRHLN